MNTHVAHSICRWAFFLMIVCIVNIADTIAVLMLTIHTRDGSRSLICKKVKQMNTNYTNCETQAICLWIDKQVSQSSTLYEYISGLAQECYDKYIPSKRDSLGVSALAEALKEWVEEYNPLVSGDDVYADLLRDALRKVNWREIATIWLKDLKLYRISNKMLYRPVANDFLDEVNPLAFWETKKGIERDFPNTKEIKIYTEEGLVVYCEKHGAKLEDLEVYY